MNTVPKLVDLAADALTVDFLARPYYWAPREQAIRAVSDTLSLLETRSLNCPYQVPTDHAYYGGRFAHREADNQVVAYDLVTGRERRVDGRLDPDYCAAGYVGVRHTGALRVYKPDLSALLEQPHMVHLVEFEADHYTVHLGDEVYNTFDYDGRLINTINNDAIRYYIGGVTWTYTYATDLLVNDAGETFPGCEPQSMNSAMLIMRSEHIVYVTHRGRQTIPHRSIINLGADWIVTYDIHGLYRHDGRDTQHWPGQIHSLELACVENDGIYTLIDGATGRARRLDLRREQICTINRCGIVTTRACYDKYGWWSGAWLTHATTVNLFSLPMTLAERWTLTRRLTADGRTWRWE